MAASGSSKRAMLGARVRVPEHVVHRNFGDETVILNLESGLYHGLNHTAATMLAKLEASDSVEAAIEGLVSELGQPREVIEPDVLVLCSALDERGLIECDPSREG
jgi:coenzyme PQQ synthesis protein D (PqqD)